MRLTCLVGAALLGSVCACSAAGGGGQAASNGSGGQSSSGTGVANGGSDRGSRWSSDPSGSSGAATSGGSATSGGQAPATGGSSASGGDAPATGGTATGGSSGAGGAPSGNGGASLSVNTARGGSSIGGTASAGSGTLSGQAGAVTSAGGATTSCNSALASANRTLVAMAIDQLFVQKDIKAVDNYWADPYLQHNPIAKSGVSTFRSLMGSIVSSSSFSYERLLTLAECDLVVVYGRYSQTGVIFDQFRVKDAKIMEHWDSDSNQGSETNGLDAHDPTVSSAAGRQLFLDFAATVLIGGVSARAGEFLSATYSEHHGTPATGPAAFTTFISAEKVTYSKVHHLIADGNYVFALSEGKRGSTSYGLYDLFRIEGGKLAEHWDSRRAVPSSTQSGLGIF